MGRLVSQSHNKMPPSSGTELGQVFPETPHRVGVSSGGTQNTVHVVTLCMASAGPTRVYLFGGGEQGTLRAAQAACSALCAAVVHCLP